MLWLVHIILTGKYRYWKFSLENLKGQGHLEKLILCGKIILKLTFKE